MPDCFAAISSEYTCQQTTFATNAGTTVQIAPNDSNRWAIIFATDTPNYIGISPDTDVAAGIPIDTGLGPVTFNMRDHASLVQLPWYVRGTGNFTITVITVRRNQ